MIGIEKATKKSHLLEQVGNNLFIVQVDFPCTKLDICSRCHEVKTVPAEINLTTTWLILPVVIRSSQRLSHACLSINIIP